MVVDYRRPTLTCLAGGQRTTSAWPADTPPGAFGPWVQATTGSLTGRLGLSQREVQEALETLYHLKVGLGSVPALEQAVSGSTAAKQVIGEGYRCCAVGLSSPLVGGQAPGSSRAREAAGLPLPHGRGSDPRLPSTRTAAPAGASYPT